MREYRYEIFTKPTNPSTHELEDWLDSLGSEGWELCCVDCERFIFKKTYGETP